MSSERTHLGHKVRSVKRQRLGEMTSQDLTLQENKMVFVFVVVHVMITNFLISLKVRDAL